VPLSGPYCGLFHRCQAARAVRRVSGRGRKGRGVANLFSGLATCGVCNAKMRYLNKGKRAYLVCEASRRGVCSTSGWPYADFEASLLAFVSEIDFSASVRGDGGQRLRE